MDLLKTVACSYGTANLLWISAIIPCLNLQINLSPISLPPLPPRSVFSRNIHTAYIRAAHLYREAQSRPFCNSDLLPRIIILN